MTALAGIVVVVVFCALLRFAVRIAVETVRLVAVILLALVLLGMCGVCTVAKGDAYPSGRLPSSGGTPCTSQREGSSLQSRRSAAWLEVVVRLGGLPAPCCFDLGTPAATTWGSANTGRAALQPAWPPHLVQFRAVPVGQIGLTAAVLTPLSLATPPDFAPRPASLFAAEATAD